MCLFSEKELLDSTGVSQEAKVLTEVELGKKVLNRKYQSSVVTYVTLEPNDWSDRYGSSSLRKLIFTPRDGYKERRVELADAFPMAIVADARTIPSELKSEAFRNLGLLTKSNYVIMPIRKKKRVDALFLGVGIYGGAGKTMLRTAQVVDVFLGGTIATEKVQNILAMDNKLIRLIWSREFMDLVTKNSVRFETAINKVEDVLS